MLWYNGSIAEAVTLSKQRNTIFVVFVEGKNDESKQMLAIIDETPISSKLSNENDFLVVKLDSTSDNYVHFARMYQFVPVPSLFFIGRNGTPLEVVCSGVETDNLSQRIDRILEEHRNTAHSSAKTPSSTSVKAESAKMIASEVSTNQAVKETGLVRTREEEPGTSSDPPAKQQKTEVHEVTASGQEYEVVCDGDVCVRRPKSMNPETSANVPDTSSSVSQPEKMERAKEIIEARRREKAQQEKELEIKRELERRATGQGVAELKKWQEEQEFKQVQEERKREKEENNLARQRVLEQIAQDKAERKARMMAASTEQTVTPPVAVNPVLNTVGDSSSHTRIQFKMPDGSSHTAQFSSDDSLGTVRRYICDNLKMSESSFSLWTAFPRRELTDDASSLRHQSLSPSAALLVLATGGVSNQTESRSVAMYSFIMTLINSLILDPAYQAWSWIRNRATQRGTAPPSSSPTQNDTTQTRYRQRTNIHRLRENNADDDDNNTWNGNSTQQM